MANVSMTLPYLFLTIAFPFFKAKTHLDRPFVIFKNRSSTLLATGVVLLVVTFANIFTIIQPVIDSGDWNSTCGWSVDRSSSHCCAGDLRKLPSAHGVRRAGDGELKNLPGGAAGQGMVYRLQRTAAGFSGRGSWFTALPAVDTFQTHLERGNGISMPCSRKPARIS